MNVSSSREMQFADEKGLKTAQVAGRNVAVTTAASTLCTRGKAVSAAGSGRQFLQQRVGAFQIVRVEPFGKPAVGSPAVTGRLFAAAAVECMAIFAGVAEVPDARIHRMALARLDRDEPLAAVGKPLELDGGESIRCE
jgi:hypothetical protein